jgi:hypothetical protein
MNPPKQHITVRQAVIKAAVTGWAGDELSDWPCPATADTIIAWAASHLGHGGGNPQADFSQLIDEGLFFEVHHGVFDPPVYYCSLDPAFLKELPAEEEALDTWKRMRERYDVQYGDSTWRAFGLCAGQGSEGPSDGPWGPCLGASCCRFEEGFLECMHDLRFAEGLHVRCRGCRQSVLRQDLREHVQPLLDDKGWAFTCLKVCSRCSTDRGALERAAARWKGAVDLDRTLKAFDNKIARK